MDFTEINSRGEAGSVIERIDRQNSCFRTAKTTIIKFGLRASFVELESTKSTLNECPPRPHYAHVAARMKYLSYLCGPQRKKVECPCRKRFNYSHIHNGFHRSHSVIFQLDEFLWHYFVAYPPRAVFKTF
ncbi:hypothetical protein TNCV_2072971 [Trichonephila clavipes]|nr:hypothetical protein TNCV_2072971 [Trichonephila clavipes]